VREKNQRGFSNQTTCHAYFEKKIRSNFRKDWRVFWWEDSCDSDLLTANDRKSNEARSCFGQRLSGYLSAVGNGGKVESIERKGQKKLRIYQFAFVPDLK
jgi:hypothetical protein